MKNSASTLAWLISFFMLVAAARDATALPRPRPAPAAQHAQVLRAAGLSALARGAFAEAGRQLESAYQSAPDVQGLYLLCQLAWSEGRTLFAKDLARRYKAEIEARPAGVPPRGDVAVSLQEVARILAFPDEPTGELAVLGPDGASLRIDGRLAGRLPLPLPLLVSVGEHQLRLDLEQGSIQAHAQVPAGRVLEIRMQPETGSAFSTLLPALVIWQEESGVPPETAPVLAEALAAVARREHLSVVARPELPTGFEAMGCAQSIECLDELAQRAGAAYVFHARIAGPQAAREKEVAAPAWQLELRLFSGELGELVSVKGLRCEGAAASAAAACLFSTLAEALALARTRPRGVLEVRSEPAAAEVWSEGRRLGTTPYVRASWTGSKRIELRLDKHLPWSGRAVIEEGRPAVLSIKLRAEPAPPPAGAPPSARPLLPTPALLRPEKPSLRPRWRLITGGVFLVSGLVLAGFGASGLSIADQCSPDTPSEALECRSSYSSLPIGASLFGLGGGFSLAGVMLLAIPGARAPVVKPAALGQM